MNLQKSIQVKLFKYYMASPYFDGILKKFKEGQSKQKIFCIGLPRSGTHSLANIFKSAFNSIHEPFVNTNLSYIIKIWEKKLDDKSIIRFIKKRDYWLDLDVEASHYLYILAPYLYKLFPDAKFILTVREPLSWIKSEMRMNLKIPGGQWGKYQNIKYSTFSQGDSIIASNEFLFPLPCYLRYYNHHIKFVMDNIPRDNLLIIDTFNIPSSLDQISSFVGLPPNSIKQGSSHRGVYKGNHEIDAIMKNITDEEIIKNILSESYDFINTNVPFLRDRMRYIQ